VLVIGLKAFQGLFIFVQIRHLNPRPEAVLGHEEAYTFALFIFLVAALRLFEVKGRLVRVATWIAPIVIAADLANNRRAAWLLLGGGLVTLAAVGYRSLPSRRRVLGRTALVALAICAVYLPAYWNKTGGLAQPARALHSMVAPDPRDASSDLYREQENDNLKYNIEQAGLVGRGFGVPIDYALPIVDISGIDPLITYVPHNGVLYILMRMGLLGGIAMWAVIGTGVIAGCRLARSADREIAAIGAVLAGLLVAYALEGATDQGFFFYRIAIVTGGLLGLAEAGRRLARSGDARPARRAPAVPAVSAGVSA
jgi:O-antigen ligase